MLAAVAILLLCSAHYQAASADEIQVAKRQVATGSSSGQQGQQQGASTDEDRSFLDGPSGPGHVGHSDSVGDECVTNCGDAGVQHIHDGAMLVHDGAGHVDQVSHSLQGVIGGQNLVHSTACEREHASNFPAIGFYTQECNENKPCESSKFCQFPPGKCMDKLLANMRCTMKGQCATGLTCQFGRCRSGTKNDKKPGSFCLNHSECIKASQCCNLARSISECVKICVPKIAKGQQCGAFGAAGCGNPGSSGFGFHGYEGDSTHLLTNADESCSPCTGTNVCKETGLIASYMICAPP